MSSSHLVVGLWWSSLCCITLLYIPTASLYANDGVYKKVDPLHPADYIRIGGDWYKTIVSADTIRNMCIMGVHYKFGYLENGVWVPQAFRVNKEKTFRVRVRQQWSTVDTV